MVAGGYGNGDFLSSCEVNIDGTRYWSYIQPLPSAGLDGIRGSSLGNDIFMSGMVRILS